MRVKTNACTYALALMHSASINRERVVMAGLFKDFQHQSLPKKQGNWLRGGDHEGSKHFDPILVSSSALVSEIVQ